MQMNKELRFSDGKSLSWMILRQPRLYDGDDHLPMDEKHGKAIMSTAGINLLLGISNFDCLRPLEETIHIPGPVTVDKIVTVMDNYFNKPVTEAQFQAFERAGWYSNWNQRMFPTWEIWKQTHTTYKTLKGDHVYFEGFSLDKEGRYVPEWGS
eukprot:TRINITY_DN2889_c0_g1_i1.p1 TRINITY_DN2889_c0_g1~~TRINITY_DN2889_c0_g1_i1.p1  ORF type:complete len:172 (+),score=16.48 TRINITY_DN2889_c0_g1_i1:60-518(+)